MECLRDPSHVRTLSRQELGSLAASAGLSHQRWADYLFASDVDRLMRASFRNPGDEARVRAMLEADVGQDALGLGLHRAGNSIRLTYPIAIVSGAR